MFGRSERKRSRAFSPTPPSARSVSYTHLGLPQSVVGTALKTNSPFWSRIRLPSSSSSYTRRCFSPHLPFCSMGRMGQSLSLIHIFRRTAKRLLSGEPLSDGRPLSDLIELDEHARKCLAFEATLTDRQIDMLQELGYLPVITRQYGKECANCPYTLDEREHGVCRRCAVFKK